MKKSMLVLFLIILIFSRKVQAAQIDSVGLTTNIITTSSAIVPDTKNSSLSTSTTMSGVNTTTSQAVTTGSAISGDPTDKSSTTESGSPTSSSQSNQTSTQTAPTKTTTIDTNPLVKPPIVVTPKPIIIINTKTAINPLAQIKPSVLYAEIIKQNKYFKIGEKVTIIEDKQYMNYYVKDSKEAAWVSKDVLLIPNDPETNKTKLNKSIIESYVKKINIKSKTAFLLWVDIDRQVLYILKNNKLYKTFECATGTNKSPTLRGTFEITKKGNWFFSNSLKEGAMYWMRFAGSYLFHSLPMNKKHQVIDVTLNKRASHGCVRLAISDIKWLYTSIPLHTKVWIN